jgi:hypothetical protein
MPTIDDGTGDCNQAKVNANKRLYTQSVIETEQQAAVALGNAYNLNTDIINITGNSAILYFKNNEDQPLIDFALAIGIGTGATSDLPRVYLVRNPTAGDIITTGTAVSLNQNRNFGSTKTIVADVFQGADGDSFTDGDDIALFMQPTDGRLFAPIDFYIPKGQSLGVRIEPQLSSGSVNVYAAIVGYLRDENK